MQQRLFSHMRATFASLSVYNYRLYFIGQGISLSGTWLQTIAQTWLIYQLTHSGTYVGLLTAFQFLPILLFGPIGGLLADRFPKRRILYCTQTVAMLLAGVLAALDLSHQVQPWMVFVLALGLGMVQVVDTPTRQTFILEMVGREQLSNAVSLNSIEVNLARVIGPAIAGGLIAMIGTGYCFLANAISYTAVLLCLLLMNGKKLQPSAGAHRAKGQIREGLRYARETPVVRNILIMMAIIGTLAYEFPVVLPLLASSSFHAGAGGYSALMGSMGLGAVVGGLVVAGRQAARTGMITVGAFLLGTTMLLVAVAPHLVVACALMVLVGAGSITFSSSANSTLQLATDGAMRGRVMSLWTMAFLGSTPIGGPLIGYISEHSSPRVGVAIGGAASIGAGLFAISLSRRARKLAEQQNPDIRPDDI